LLVGATAFALSFTRWRGTGQVLLGVTLAALWVFATPFFANWLSFSLESQFPPVSVDNLPQSDVVIVLGGVLGQPFPPRIAADLSDSSDRLLHALRIYRAHKAARIVISAGNRPWQATMNPEAQLIADFLAELGVPRSALILDTESRNTRENAVRTAAVFKEHGWRSGLLVTSGVHMPRAVAAFQRAGLSVTAAATDVHANATHWENLSDLMPDVGALALTTRAIKEIVGLYLYRSRGWA
jgi:uncharacterized SAM-binding protein YcdF (DUF218 family)